MEGKFVKVYFSFNIKVEWKDLRKKITANVINKALFF